MVYYGDVPFQSEAEKDLAEVGRIMKKHGWQIVSREGDWTTILRPVPTIDGPNSPEHLSPSA